MALVCRNLSTLRRFNVIHRILTTNNNKRVDVQRNVVRFINSDGKITIDGITKILKKPQHPEIVPQKFRK